MTTRMKDVDWQEGVIRVVILNSGDTGWDTASMRVKAARTLVERAQKSQIITFRARECRVTPRDSRGISLTLARPRNFP